MNPEGGEHDPDLLKNLLVHDQLAVELPEYLGQGGPVGNLPDEEECHAPELLHLPGGVEGMQDKDRM